MIRIGLRFHDIRTNPKFQTCSVHVCLRLKPYSTRTKKHSSVLVKGAKDNGEGD